MTQVEDGWKLPGIAGRVAVVTGAGRGIGRAIATLLRAQGAAVAALDIAGGSQPDPGAGPGGWLDVQCDVADEDSVDRAFGEVEAQLGRISILVNNAGILRAAAVLETSLEDFNRMLQVNAGGPFLCARRALPGMIDQRYGRIVTIASSAGRTGGSGRLIAYAASKAAAISVAKSIATEYSAFGVTSNAVAPAAIDTEMIQGLGDYADRLPVRRLGTVDDVAAAVAFLCSDLTGYMTGGVVDVNGGFLMV